MVIALKTSYTMPAHASLAPFGTWWSVATLTPRIEPRDGRAEVEVGVEVEVGWGGGALIGGRATLTEDSVGCRKPRPAGDDGGLGPEDDDSETGGSFPGTGGAHGAEFWHPPKRPGRQLTQVFPSFTQLHFLQMPERLQRQHGIIGQAPSPSPPGDSIALKEAWAESRA